MTRHEIISALKGTAAAVLTIGLYWLMFALADAGGLF
jgi:hypothetical protein